MSVINRILKVCKMKENLVRKSFSLRFMTDIGHIFLSWLSNSNTWDNKFTLSQYIPLKKVVRKRSKFCPILHFQFSLMFPFLFLNRNKMAS